jgi:hypothetical protein
MELSELKKITLEDVFETTRKVEAILNAKRAESLLPGVGGTKEE